MKLSAVLSAAGVAALTAGTALAGGTTVYDNEADFLSNIEPGSYFEGFDGVPIGAAGPILSFTDGTFSYDITATGAGSNNLFNDPGLVSTDSALDALVITFTSGNVTAVGGRMFASDILFFPIGADMTATLSDGTVVNFSSPGDDFRGFTSDMTITSLTIDASDAAANAWATLDNLRVGVIPAPGTMALLGFGGLAATRRRR